jgi:hypothetical protein
MIRSAIYLILSIPLLFLASCNKSAKSSYDMLPGASGRIGEVIVVMPDSQWNGIAGQAIRDAFYASYDLLPQHEPCFDLKHQDPPTYGRFFREHRNVLMVLIEDHIDSQVASTNEILNKHSKNQRIVEVRAKNTSDFLEEFQSKSGLILEKFHDAEIARATNMNAGKVNPLAHEILDAKFGIEMDIPTSFTEIVGDSAFSWFKKNWDERNPELEKAIVVYSYPYVSDSAFSIYSIIENRDRILGEYIHGSRATTDMITEHFYEPLLDTIDVGGRFTARVKGLWKIKGAFLGGPFVSYSFLDASTYNVVTVEGYIFAPHEDKRDHMRSVEAIVRSARPTILEKE